MKNKLCQLLTLILTLSVLSSCAQTVFVDPSAGTCQADAGNTGDGTCTIGTVYYTVVSETLTLTATSSGPNATFSVTGSSSGSLGTITSGSLQTVQKSSLDYITVTLSDGGTPYAVNDEFTVTLTPGSELVEATFDQFDLEQVCANGCSSEQSMTVDDKLTVDAGSLQGSLNMVSTSNNQVFLDLQNSQNRFAFGVDGSGNFDLVDGLDLNQTPVRLTITPSGAVSIGEGGGTQTHTANGNLDVSLSVGAGNGSAANPSFNFTTDGNTGFFRSAEDTIGVSFNGTNRINLSLNGLDFLTANGIVNSVASLFFNVDSNNNDTASVFEVATNRSGASGGDVWLGIDSNGATTIGASGGTQTHTVNGQQLNLTNTNTNDLAGININPNGTGAAYLWFNHDSAQDWITGVSSSGSYSVSRGATVASTPEFQISNAGAVTMGESGSSEIITANTSQISLIGPSSSNAAHYIQADSGDALVHYRLSGVQSWYTGLDDSDNDSFKISPAVFGTDDVFVVTTNGVFETGNPSRKNQTHTEHGEISRFASNTVDSTVKSIEATHTFNVSSAPEDQDIATVDVSSGSTSNAVAIHMKVVGSDNNGNGEVFDVLATVHHDGTNGVFNTPVVSSRQETGSFTDVTAAWVGSGDSRTLRLTANDASSAHTVDVRISDRVGDKVTLELSGF